MPLFGWLALFVVHAPSAILLPRLGSGARIVAVLVLVVERPQLLDRRLRHVLPVQDVDAAVLEVVHDLGRVERLGVRAPDRRHGVVRAARRR